MLSVIVDAREAPRRLPALLAQLTGGAVEGLVREVFIVAPHSDKVQAICEDMGAEAADTIEAALAWAKGETALVLPADLRLRDGWIEALTEHLAADGGDALVSGLSEGGLLSKRPYGVLVARSRVVRLENPDLKRLRRQLGLRPLRIG
ncbi:glycosyltransferase family A protein [Phenylobacterium sp.]|uniref:glycosyltransferase family A protein n=1 Tax=Phenylobacterium sp. TaxID=1871053 RepID=UPI0028121ADC|nr:glycosyltransferase family A protein [Phenylobacterium sp.]